MPRPAPLRVVAVAALLIPAISCALAGSPSGYGVRYMRAPAKFPITVKIGCDNAVTVAITDANSRQAWSVELTSKDEASWESADDHITSLDIVPKNPADWPLDNDRPHGGKKGNPAKAKVKEKSVASTYPYTIEAVCQRTTGAPITVTIDPEMILLPGMTDPTNDSGS